MRRRALRDPHVRAKARRLGAPARAQAQPSTDGPRNAAHQAGASVYEYNLARQVTHATRPDGLETDYTYDAAGRLNGIVTPSGTSQPLTPPDGVSLENPRTCQCYESVVEAVECH